MRKIIIAVTLALICGAGAWGQNVPSFVIDGSQSPAQIPDVVAFRLWLEGNANAVNGPIRSIRRIHLPSPDAALLIAAMTQYSTQNNSLTSVRNTGQTTRPAYWSGVYSLVGSLLTNLQTNMSPIGFSLFEEYLQNQRQGMRVSPIDYGLGAVAARNAKEMTMVASMGHAMPQADGMTPNYSMYYDKVLSLGYYHNADNFDRGNGAPNPAQGGGSPWVVPAGSTEIYNDAIIATSNGSPATSMYYNSTTHKDGCSTAVLAAAPSINGWIGITFRESNASNYYTAKFWNNNGSLGIAVSKMVAGTGIWLPSGNVPYSYAVGDTLTLCAIGSNIDVLENGIDVYSTTDTSLTSGYAGVTGVVNGGALKNFSTGSGFVLTANATLTGDTTCSAGCPVATHTGKVTNTLGSAGNTVQYAGPPTTQFNLQNVQNFLVPTLLPGDDSINFDLTGEVICSIAGTFFNSPDPDNGSDGIAGEWAITMSEWIGALADVGWRLAPVCTAVSSPPDWGYNTILNLDGPPPPPEFPYYKARTYCVSLTGPGEPYKWICADDFYEEDEEFLFGQGYWDAGATQQFIDHGDGSAYNCTNASKLYTGEPFP